MQKILKDKFPSWCSDFTRGHNTTVLTDDIDSLLGASIENYIKGNNINYFYDFNNLYIMDQNDKRQAIGIDLALHIGKCWDNHVVSISSNDEVNPESANVNAIFKVSSENYTNKYAMSTVLTMWSYYNLPLPKTKEGKMILLAIDSGFLGHYNSTFQSIHTKYLELLEFTELIDLLNQSTKSDFYNIQDQYRLKSKININENGYLDTKLPLAELQGFFNFKVELPRQQFTLSHSFKNNKISISQIKSISQLDNLISFALTRKTEVKYTIA